ncbi:MAG TPA: amino acid permease [Candidatus Dormibacteraeota bacterium]|nr:amino acid permease [Candidatus Dormibacteraeota bacterium]
MKLRRRLGTLDVALVTIGGIVGSGIFRTPSVVAHLLGSPFAILLVWALGGAISLLGALVLGELAARRPLDGGLYAYLRDAFHPALAFVFGWMLLFIAMSGGAASAAIAFAGYAAPVFGVASSPIVLSSLAVAAVLLFTGINAFGVRAGANAQNGFMIAKIAAFAIFIFIAFFGPHVHVTAAVVAAPTPSLGLLGIAMLPVLFSYLGWGPGTYVSAEIRDPARSLPRGLALGVLGVTVLYLAINAVLLHALGITALSATTTPIADVARVAFGPTAQRVVGAVVALSLLGFVSNQLLTAPRVYYQMGVDGVFFQSFAKLDPRTGAPIVAILVQAVIVIALTLSRSYDQLLTYITSADFLFLMLAGIALFIIRARDARSGAPEPRMRIPLHPYSTALFVVVSFAIVTDALVKAPVDTAIGWAIILTGLPVYAIFAARKRAQQL